MKQIVHKEIREQLKVAAPAMLVLSLTLLVQYKNSIDTARQILQNNNLYEVDNVQPLLSNGTHIWVTVICDAFAAILGALQIFSERPRDRWAFFIHRPLTRSQLFVGKITAGLMLYFAAMLLPIAFLVGIAATPGHIAAPFEWQMTMQILQWVVAGVPFYFAGMICVLRPVRWYGSRILPLGMGLAAAGAASLPSFASEMVWVWPALAFLAVISAASASACFRTDGSFETQSRIGKFSTIVTLFSGTIAVCLLAGLLAQLFSPSQNREWSFYIMGKDGTIYKVTQSSGDPRKIYDLKGNLVKDPDTNKPIDDQRFNKMISYGPTARADFFDDRKERREQFFTAWVHQRRDLWYWTRKGNLEGYNVVTRQKIGSIAAPEPFRQPTEPWLTTWQSRQAMASPDAVYAIDYGKRSAARIWSCATDERIVGMSEIQYAVDQDKTARGYAMILTPRRLVLILRDEAATVLDFPMKIAGDDNVSLHFLNDHQFSVWRTAIAKDGKESPTHVMWISATGSIAREMELPSLERPQRLDFGDKIFVALLPTIISIPGAIFANAGNDSPFSRAAALGSVVLGILCAAVALMRLRRYSFSTGAQVGWAVATLLGGLPFLLTFLCVYEWPARVRCPQCAERRVVTNERCEHCEAAFAPPPKAGVEIFAPLVKT
jgi:hypothetical protein